MNIRMICLTLLVLFIQSFSAETATSETRQNVALSDLAGKGIDSSTAEVISDRLRNELFNTGTVTVLERSQMQSILKEQGFQQVGCTSDQCAIETGQLLGVKFMIVGSIGLVGHTYTVSCRLIDVSTGKMVGTATVDCRCEIDDILSRSTVEIAHKLVQSLQPSQGLKTSAMAIPKPVQTVIETGTLKVSSNPPGALLFVNDSIKGNTPVRLDGLNTGKYYLKLDLQGYKTLTDNVQIYSGKTEEKSYILKEIVILKPQEQSKKTKFGNWPKITSGIGTVVAVGAGLFCNIQAQKYFNNATQISNSYKESGNDAGYNTFATDYATARKNGNNYLLYRNICYGVAGVALLCFGVSFAF